MITGEELFPLPMPPARIAELCERMQLLITGEEFSRFTSAPPQLFKPVAELFSKVQLVMTGEEL